MTRWHQFARGGRTGPAGPAGPRPALRRRPRVPVRPTGPRAASRAAAVRSRAVPAVPIAILLILPFGPGPRAGERPADPAAGALCPVAAALAAVPPEAGHPAAEVPAAEVPAAASPAATAPAASHLPVPTEDPILDDLEHFRALGWWHGGLGLRPLSRGEVARAVRAISSSASLRDVAGGNAERLRRIRSRVAAWGLEEDPAEGEPSLARLELRGRLRLHAVASALDTLSDLDRRARREHRPGPARR